MVSYLWGDVGVVSNTLFTHYRIVKYTWLLLLLITVALPTLVYLMLFVLNWLDDPLRCPWKQKWLRYGYIAMLLLTAFKVTPMDHYPILYFYIMNLLISTFVILLMHYLKFVGNMFVMGVGALTVFSILLGVIFEIDMTYIVALFIFLQWSHPFQHKPISQGNLSGNSSSAGS